MHARAYFLCCLPIGFPIIKSSYLLAQLVSDDNGEADGIRSVSIGVNKLVGAMSIWIAGFARF